MVEAKEEGEKERRRNKIEKEGEKKRRKNQRRKE